MTLADELADAGRQARKGPPCRMGVVLAALTPDDRTALQDALDGDGLTSNIGAALRRHGHDIGDHTINRHRRGICLCGRWT